MSTHKKCLVCNSQDIRPLKGYYKKNGLVKCCDCSFVFMEKIPTVEELTEYYSAYSYEGENFLSPLTVKRYNEWLDEFEKYRKTGKLLDVGCGEGWFLQEAKKRGWEVYGTEFSQTAFDKCTANGIKMHLGVLNPDNYKLEDFDIITSIEVMEHINNPNEELTAIASLLRKGGLFYCTTPNFNSVMRYYLKSDYNVIIYPEHLSYYTKKTLNKVAAQNSLKPYKFESTGISITRIKKSKKLSDEKIIGENSSDEILRNQIEGKWYLQLGKNIINSLLSITSSGLSLKGHYIKQ